MALTAEQQERIRQNRERALAIQRERANRQERDSSATKRARSSNNEPTSDPSTTPSPRKQAKADDTESTTISATTSQQNPPEEELEDFEIGASDLVTRQDAMKVYCLPAGTLEVCQSVERPNPRNSSWKPMRLYHRQEIRARAHKRFGGLDGLIQERQSRADKRLSVDMEKAKQLFR